MGKTALVEMLSILWNQSLLGDWRLLRDRVLALLRDVCYCELFEVEVASTVGMRHCGPPNGCSGPVGGALKV